MPRPNILIVTTDQQRTDSLSCYGSPFVHTPHLDRLAGEGALCERAYCTNPVCTPSRASIFSGRYPSRHGAWNVGMNVPEDEVFVSHRLQAAGYRTHYIGKAHFQAFGAEPEDSVEARRENGRYPGFSGPYYGFETVELALGHATYGLAGHYGEWVRQQVSPEAFAAYGRAESRSALGFGGQAYDWDLPVRLHNSAWTAERALAFLDAWDGERPFLLALGFQDPHHPHCLPRDFEQRLDPEKVPLPAYQEGELEDKPPHFMAARRGKLEESPFRGQFPVAGQGKGADFAQVSDEDARWGRAYYYGMVKIIDQQMGRVLAGLEERGLAENTLVVFTSDHGELLGDHGLWMKGPFHYEELVRVPLIWRWPAGLAGGRRVGGIASLADLVPTLLAACGQEIPGELDGVDLLPLLRGEVEAARPWALVECTDDPQGLRLKTAVEKARKLTWYAGEAWGELYDLERDPQERVNRWGDAAYAGDRARLLGRLLEESEKVEKRAVRLCYA